MSQTSKPADEGAETVRQAIVLEGEAGAVVPEGDRDLGAGTIVQPTHDAEPVRKPPVIGVEPETDEEDGSRTPKNTNMDTIEA